MRTCCHGLRQSWRTGMRRFRRCRWCFHGMIYSSLRGSRRDRYFCLTICTLKPARRIASTWLEGPSWAVVNHFSREQLFCSKSFVVHHHPQSQQSKCHWRPSARIPYHCTHTHMWIPGCNEFAWLQFLKNHNWQSHNVKADQTWQDHNH